MVIVFKKVVFPDDLKIVSPIFKKQKVKMKKKLSQICEVFERTHYKQINNRIKTRILKVSTSFQLQNKSQFSLLFSKDDGNLKKNLEKRNQIGLILVVHLKTFYTINHSLLLAHGFSTGSLKLNHNYHFNAIAEKIMGNGR